MIKHAISKIKKVYPCKACAHISLLSLSLCFSLAACGVGTLQTAHTTPAKTLDVSLGLGYIHNYQVEERGISLSNYPPFIGLRYGLSEQMELAASLSMLTGLHTQIKYNLMPNEQDFALALSGGVGVARDLLSEEQKTIFSVPVGAILSYRVAKAFEPYAGIAYTSHWTNIDEDDRPILDLDSNQSLAKRAYHGDGVLNFTIGNAFHLSDSTRLLLEYNFWWAVLDDPGDFYSFVNNHIFMAGVTF